MKIEDLTSNNCCSMTVYLGACQWPRKYQVTLPARANSKHTNQHYSIRQQIMCCVIVVLLFFVVLRPESYIKGYLKQRIVQSMTCVVCLKKYKLYSFKPKKIRVKKEQVDSISDCFKPAKYIFELMVLHQHILPSQDPQTQSEVQI